jgi:5'-phosphate synthase pdxT subunit
VKIGVLALQGDFSRHAAALARCGAEAIEIRKPAQLAEVDGLIMPGGESTTLLKLMHEWGFVPALEGFHRAGKPIFGTCAGLILLAREVTNPKQFALGFIDVGVERNAYGRQRESFETAGMATLEGQPVMAREGSVLVATFHPELTDDATVHAYFCDMVAKAREGVAA